MLVELQGLMKHLGDGHCYVMPAHARAVRSTWLPLQLYHFSDGLFVIDAAEGHERWVGRRLLRLGPVSADDAMKRMADVVSRDNEMGVRWIGPFLLRFRGTLEMLGLPAGAPRIKLTYAGEKGAA